MSVSLISKNDLSPFLSSIVKDLSPSLAVTSTIGNNLVSEWSRTVFNLLSVALNNSIRSSLSPYSSGNLSVSSLLSLS